MGKKGTFSQNLAGRLISRLTGEEVAPDETMEANGTAAPPKKKAAPDPVPMLEEHETVDLPEEAVSQPQSDEPVKVAPDTDPSEPRSDENPEDDTESGNKESANEDQKQGKRKKLLLIGGGIALALVLIIAVASMMSGAGAKVDLLGTMDIKLTERVSGYGRVDVAIKEDALTQAIINSGAMLPKDVTAADVTKAIIDNTVITVEPSCNLSNGDKVTITATVDENVLSTYPGVGVQNVSYEWTAEGMVEGMFFDPFAATSINVRVEGNSGSANAYLDILAKGAHVYYLNYDWSPRTGLKNGDTVVVTVKPVESKLSELGYAIPETRAYEIPVGGLNEMVEDPKDIPNTYLNSMVSYAEGQLANAYASVPYVEGQDIVITAPEITSIYFLDKADKSSPYSDWFTKLQMTNAIAVLGHFYVQDIEPVTTETEEGEKATNNEVVETYGGYYVWIFPDMVRKPGGDYTYNQSMITMRTTSYQTESDCLVWIKNEFSGFSVQKIGTNTSVL